MEICTYSVCADFRVMFMQEKKVKKKYLDAMHHLYVLDSERGGGPEKRQVFVSK